MAVATATTATTAANIDKSVCCRTFLLWILEMVIAVIVAVTRITVTASHSIIVMVGVRGV